MCDLTQAIPKEKVQLALVLKTLPCLEQLDKLIAKRLFTEIQAEHILFTFPVRSLGGRAKGMEKNYEEHFYQVLPEGWEARKFLFQTEMAFLVSHQ